MGARFKKTYMFVLKREKKSSLSPKEKGASPLHGHRMNKKKQKREVFHPS